MKLTNILKLATFFILALPGSQAADSDFLNLCQVTLLQNSDGPKVCQQLNQQFFAENKSKDLAPLDPKQVNASAMDIDSKIQFIVFNDPNYLPGVAYCYFVFRGWISMSTISPDGLATLSTGFSILNEQLKEYQRWLDSNAAGKQCKALVQSESGVPAFDLKSTLNNSVALVALNPYAGIKSHGANFKAIMDDMSLTLNHERIHAYQAMCPELDKWGQAEWGKLVHEEKVKYQQKYPSYNWNDGAVAGREFIAFKYEENPKEVLKHLGKCGSK